MAYISDCLMEICNTHTITFGYQTPFFNFLPSGYILHGVPLIVYCEYKDQE